MYTKHTMKMKFLKIIFIISKTSKQIIYKPISRKPNHNHM